jgi:hypothetical protein
MESFEKTILLNFDRKYFEEIYFKDNQHSILLSPILRREIIPFIVALFLFISSFAYSYINDKIAWLIMIFFLFSLCRKTLNSFVRLCYRRWVAYE